MNIENKLRPIYIAKILLERTDEDHVLTTNELIDILEREYHISAHRTTVSDDIQVLAQASLDVDMIKSTQNKYRVLSRTFDLAEIKLLIDAVESSKFITEKKSESLIKKLQKQASIHSADALKRNLKACSRLMLDSIEGTCVFTPEQVKKRMDVVQQSVNDLSAKIEDLQNKATETAELTEEIKAEHQRLLSWAEVYDGASLEEKKMVASYLIKAVTISQNYGIQIDFNITEAQYLSGMEMM